MAKARAAPGAEMTVTFDGARERHVSDGHDYLYSVETSESLECPADLRAWYEASKVKRLMERTEAMPHIPSGPDGQPRVV